MCTQPGGGCARDPLLVDGCATVILRYTFGDLFHRADDLLINVDRVVQLSVGENVGGYASMVYSFCVQLECILNEYGIFTAGRQLCGSIMGACNYALGVVALLYSI